MTTESADGRMSRVFIETPSENDRDAFVDAVRRSGTLHERWVRPPATREAFGEYLSRLGTEEHDGFLVRLCSTAEIAGAINISNIIRGVFQSAFLGYYAFAPHAANGYMKDGMLLVLDHAFAELGLHRLEANIQPGNAASIASVRSCGFRKEGFSRRYLKVNGEWQDHERWALLADEHSGGGFTD